MKFMIFALENSQSIEKLSNLIAKILKSKSKKNISKSQKMTQLNQPVLIKKY